MTNPMPAEPRKFQKGDRVRCVNASGSGGALDEGCEYVVKGPHLDAQDDIYLVGITASWLQDRFILASPAVDEGQGWEVHGNGVWSGPGCTIWGDRRHAIDRDVGCLCGLTVAQAQERGFPRSPQPAAEGKLCAHAGWDPLLERCQDCGEDAETLTRAAQPSPVKADKRDPYADYRLALAHRFGGDWEHAQQEIHAVTKLKDESSGRRERLIAALKADLSTSTAKRRQRLGARFDGRVGIDLEQAWSTPGDES